MKKSSLIFLLLLSSVFLGLGSCTSMGTNPDGKRFEKISASANFNNTEEIFQNPVVIPTSLGRPWYEIMYDIVFNGENRTPNEKLPEAPPELRKLDIKMKQARFIWFGHSTILLEIDGQRILIDPIFSDYASPIRGIGKRFQPPVLNIDDIKDIDFVLISHDHYDHLDHKTILKLKERKLQYIVPLGVGAHLEYWGIESDKITELDWWNEIKVKGLTLTCTPAQHFSGRGLFNRNTTLWASWAIKSKHQNIYFSGDSGYSKHYKEIGDRLGPFDIAFLENGAYNSDWKFVHQLPEEGVQASLDLKSRTMVPIHWGMFDLALHSWYEPIQRVTAEAKKKGVTIIAPKLGQLVSTEQKYKQETWWQPLIETTQKIPFSNVR